MKILDKDFELKYNLRTQFIFESITGKPFEIKQTIDQYILFFCCILSVKGQTIEFDEFIDWCDEHPECIVEFGEFIAAELKKRDVFPEKKSQVENS